MLHLTIIDEELSARGRRLQHLYKLIVDGPGFTEDHYHRSFLKAWAVKPRTWREYISDVMLKYDIIKVIDDEIRSDLQVFYVQGQWEAIQNEREEKRVRAMKDTNQIKLQAFE